MSSLAYRSDRLLSTLQALVDPLSLCNMQNLDEAHQESLQALVKSIAPELANSSNGNGDIVDKLADKLKELVGEEGIEKLKQKRNERGELVNEEGLPIIEITEPMDGRKSFSSVSLPTPITVEPLLPVFTLDSSVQARLREKRHRILDMLEEEERQAELAENEFEAREREKLVRKRKEEALKDKDRLKAARELQKKMGRALLQNFSREKELERQELEVQRRRDEEVDKRKSPSIKKKTVAFAESTEDIEKGSQAELPEGPDWGDVSPATLRTTKRPTLMSQKALDKHPMKMTVVERYPTERPPAKNISPPPRPLNDSDDESDPDPDLAPNTDTEEEEEAVLETDEVDLDFARHQREIALEYHKKRNAIGQEAAAAMKNHSHDADGPMQQDIDLMPDTSRPAISQFRAEKIAAAFNASVPSSEAISLGDTILPASSARTIQGAIRTGNIDEDGKLVGGEADSASEEEDQGMQQVLELLRKGEVYNIGPNEEYLHTIPPSTSSPSGASSSKQVDLQNPIASSTLPPPSMRSKTSKFKASRVAAGRPSSSSSTTRVPSGPNSEPISPSVTPVSDAARSSPKLGTSAPAAPLSAIVSGRVAIAGPSTAMASPQPGKSPSQQIPPQFSMIIESPSFPNLASQGPLDSSDVPAPSMAMESPSFPSSQSSSRPERPPAIISSAVREREKIAPINSQNTISTASSEAGPRKKASRFKAERM
ncbi:unnamed protein product [Cyclocybe aegerita]|uniref:DUF3835 domain-containing protein n=1 Tax=Cyclocybe aegerita TaxID=1973307 RepID=A0A8S0X270_CYCAE|nr:unnamed protein product [Cyclocybe aegerita]